jgi:hypothetical protein
LTVYPFKEENFSNLLRTRKIQTFYSDFLTFSKTKNGRKKWQCTLLSESALEDILILKKEFSEQEYFFFFFILYCLEKKGIAEIARFQLLFAVLEKKFSNVKIQIINSLISVELSRRKNCSITIDFLNLISWRLLGKYDFRALLSLFDNNSIIRKFEILLQKFGIQSEPGHPKGQFRRGHTDKSSPVSKLMSDQKIIKEEEAKDYWLKEKYEEYLKLKNKQRQEVLSDCEILTYILKLHSKVRTVNFLSEGTLSRKLATFEISDES